MISGGWFRWALPIAALLLAGACESDGGSSPPAFNVNGRWDVSEAWIDCDCPVCTPNAPYVLDVTLSGGALTVRESNLGMTFTGTSSGDNIDWSGSYPQSGGTSKVTGTDITVTDGGARFSGSASWLSALGFGFGGVSLLDLRKPGTQRGLQPGVELLADELEKRTLRDLREPLLLGWKEVPVRKRCGDQESPSSFDAGVARWGGLPWPRALPTPRRSRRLACPRGGCYHGEAEAVAAEGPSG